MRDGLMEKFMSKITTRIECKKKYLLFLILYQKFIINFTTCSNNVQRIISGKLSITGKGGEGRFNVRYESFPLSYDASLGKLTR